VQLYTFNIHSALNRNLLFLNCRRHSLRRIFGFITANACIEQTFLKLNPSFACKRSFIFFNKNARFLNVNKTSYVWDIHSIFFLFERIFYGIKYEI